MAQETCDTSSVPAQEIPAQARYAAEWGLAALLLAGVLIVAALLTAIFGLLYAANLDRMRPSRGDVQTTALVSGILTGLFWLFGLIDVCCALVGVRAAWRRCQPGGLPVVGLLLAILAVLLWSAIGFGLLHTVQDFQRRGVM